MITVMGYIDMLRPKSAIHRLPRTSTPLTDNTLLMGTNGNETNAISLEEVKEYLGPAGGGSGGGGGINVIEYDPSLHKQATPVVNTDWTPVGNTAVWDSATGVMGVGTPNRVWSKGYEFGGGTTACNTEYAALKLDLATLSETRSITIDATLCNDAFGFMFIPKGVSVSEVFEGRWFRSQGGNYPNDSFMIFTTAQKVLGEYYFNLYGKEYVDGVQTDSFSDSTLYHSALTTKPQGIYTISIRDFLAYFLEQEGFATEQELIDYYVAMDIPVEEFMLELNAIREYDAINVTPPGISDNYPRKAFTENMDLYLVMTPYVGTHAASFNLDPTSQIQISYDIMNIDHSAPNDAVDGDILHLTEKASISGKLVSKDSFVQLYANKTKYILLSGTVKSFEE